MPRHSSVRRASTASPVGEVRKALLTLDWGAADDRDRDQKVLERLCASVWQTCPGRA